MSAAGLVSAAGEAESRRAGAARAREPDTQTRPMTTTVRGGREVDAMNVAVLVSAAGLESEPRR
jgi:hypothetical protein